MLWPVLEQLHRLLGITVRQRLHEVRILGTAVRARNAVAVITVKVQPLMRMQQKLETIVALLKKKETSHYVLLVAKYPFSQPCCH